MAPVLAKERLLSSFTAEVVDALSGPNWLRRRRADAFGSFSAAPLPTEAEEVWRYSRISELDLDRYEPALDGAGPRVEVDPALEASGVVVGDLADVDDGDDVLGAVAGAAVDSFVELNVAFLVAPLLVRVPDGLVVEEPIIVEHRLEAGGAAMFPRLVVQVGRDADVTVIERHVSSDVDALVVPVTELDVAEFGRLRYVDVQVLGPRVWQVAYQASRVARDATLQASAVALGGSYARLRTDSRLVGKGASSQLLAVYFGEGEQMHDFRTMQDHAAPNTTSDLLFKGAVQDQARSVYSGLIRVRKEAAGTNAFQTNRNLVLSEGAHADSVPNLEIEANDVRCSHASAVGPIDAEQLYYLESRGVPPDVAERLIVLGFFDEVIDRLPVGPFERELRTDIAGKLDRRRA